ncbi:hypothetical protein N9L68_06765 [bacterium]|nr:hypothetical protein [bacterium]
MVALGGRMVDFAKSVLVASAQDDALEKPCQACADIGKVIVETSHDKLDESGVVKGKQFAVLYPTFSKKAPAVSLTKIVVLYESPRPTLTASAKVNNKSSVNSDAYFADLFQQAQPSEDTLPDQVDVDMLIEAAARGCSKLTKDQLEIAGRAFRSRWAHR